MGQATWKKVVVLGVLLQGCRGEGREKVVAAAPPVAAEIHRQWSFEAGIDPGFSVRFRASESYADEPLLDELDPQPRLDGPGAVGEHAVRIVIPARSRVIVHTPVKPTESGAYTFSTYLRRGSQSDRPFGVAIRLRRSHQSGGSDYSPSAEIVGESSGHTAANWSRLAVTAKAGGWIFAEVEAEGPGELWLDAMQLERAPQPSAFSAAPELLASVRAEARTPADPIGVITRGDRATVSVEVSRSLAAGERLSCRVLDPFGNEAPLVLSRVGTDPKRWQSSWSTAMRGPHRVRVELKDAQSRDLVVAERDFVVLDPPPPVEDRAAGVLGTHTPLNARHLAIAARLGYGWLRLHDASMVGHWLVAEPAAGRSSYFDSQVELAHRAGFGILGVLEETPRWASSAPPALRWQEARSFPPRKIGDWSAYVRNAVGHYRGRIDHWEIWNEPYLDEFWRGTPAQYRSLVETAIWSANAVSDRAVLLASASGEPGRISFTEASLAIDPLQKGTGGEASFPGGPSPKRWGLAFHAYDRRLADGTRVSTSAASELSRFRSPGAPFWQTEGTVLGAAASLPAPWSFEASERSGAALVGWVLELVSRGAERVFTYALVESEYGSDADLALLGPDGAPRAPAAALARLAGALAGRRFERSFRARDFAVSLFEPKAIGAGHDPLAVLLAADPLFVPAGLPCAAEDGNGNPAARSRKYRLLYCPFEEKDRHRLLEAVGEK